jgi:hypothetical protein
MKSAAWELRKRANVTERKGKNLWARLLDANLAQRGNEAGDRRGEKRERWAASTRERLEG